MFHGFPSISQNSTKTVEQAIGPGNPRAAACTQRLTELEQTVASLHHLPHQLNLLRRDGEADEVPGQGLERLARHGQDVVHAPARHRPRHDQAPRQPVFRPRARLSAVTLHAEARC